MTNAKSGLDAGLFLDEDDDYVVFESGSNKGMCFVSLGGHTVHRDRCEWQQYAAVSWSWVRLRLSRTLRLHSSG